VKRARERRWLRNLAKADAFAGDDAVIVIIAAHLARLLGEYLTEKSSARSPSGSPLPYLVAAKASTCTR
jgi:hypothetical protein